MPEIYRIDQALFGYKNGHHLLAASTNVIGRELERLLVLTDIAPNASFGGVDGYWTGVPLPDSNRYAVIRTWPAPEMPRPGCVWSHVLILSTPLVEEAWDVKSLVRLFARPVIEDGFEVYQTNLALMQPEPVEDWSETKSFVEALHEVYGDRRVGFNLTHIQSIGAALLAAWSQQWPKLRSSFRYRTLPKQANHRNAILQFDFYWTSPERVSTESGEEESWLAVAEEDANAPQPSYFREYYRRFGPLLEPTLSSFALLGQVYAMKCGRDERSIKTLIEALHVVFPRDEEASDFKRQLFTFDETYEKLLWDGAALETIRMLVDSGQEFSLRDTLLEESNIRFFWKYDVVGMIELIRYAFDTKNEFANLFLKAVATKSSRGQLDSLGTEPELYLALAKYDESLLSTTFIQDLGETFLLRMIAAMQDGTTVAKVFCGTIYKQALKHEIVKELFEHIPLAAVKQTSKSLSLSLNREPGNTIWLEIGSSYATEALRHDVLPEFETSAELAAFAELLDYFRSDVVTAVGCVPWSSALGTVEDDIDGSSRLTFQAFLLTLALRHPDRGAVGLLRYSFESLHRALWDSTLNHQASVLIEPVLPHPRWFWQSWDVCLRLRRAVVRVFIDGEFSTADFLSIADDTALLGVTLEALDDSRFEDRQFREAVTHFAGDDSQAKKA